MSIQKVVSRRMVKAIMMYRLIEPGDRILAAVSGGKDSTTMSFIFSKLLKGFPIPFELHSVHVKTDFCKCDKKSRLADFMEEHQLSYSVIQAPVMARLQSGKSMNCYWCSTQRRMELIKYAEAHNFNKIALGHHQDDILETFLMNMVYKGELSTMVPKLEYDTFPYTIIRPLALVEESQIIRFAKEYGIRQLVCPCPYGQNSKRREMRNALETLTQGAGKLAKKRMFHALSNPQPKYLPSKPSNRTVWKSQQRERATQTEREEVDSL